MNDINSHSLKELAYAHHKGMLSFPDYRAKRAELLDQLHTRKITEEHDIDDTREFVTPVITPRPPARPAPDNSILKLALAGLIVLILISIATVALMIN